jgi:outer membrane protein assembly factor BamB
LVAGVAVTSGGVLCTGDLTNDFLAVNASNGETLYRFNTGGAVGGGVITYEMDVLPVGFSLDHFIRSMS